MFRLIQDEGTQMKGTIWISILLAFVLTACSGSVPKQVQPTAEPEPSPTISEKASYSPDLRVYDVRVESGNLNIEICFKIPSADKDWVLGRLPGDVYISAGNQDIPMQFFNLVSLEPDGNSTFPLRCDKLVFSAPSDFETKESTLTVERIAASMPSDVDWDDLLHRLDEVAPGLEIKPMPDQGGPSFGIVRTPEGMTDIEAHNLVLGLVEPVIIGPWNIPIKPQ